MKKYNMLKEVEDSQPQGFIEREKKMKKDMEITTSGGWIYGGLFLDRDNALVLDMLYDEVLPRGWRRFASHCTIAFNNHTSRSHFYYLWMKRREGKKYKMKVTHIGYNDEVIAFKVELEDGMLCKNEVPHITYGVSPNGEPKMSNNIKRWYPINREIYVEGTMKIIMK